MRSRSHVPRKDLTPPLPKARSVNPILEISVNALAQKNIANEIKKIEEKLTKLEQIYIITNPQF